MSYQTKRLIPFDGPGCVKAYADLSVNDALLIRGFRVIQGKHKLFVSWPTQTGKDGRVYGTVLHLSKAVKREIEQNLLDTYAAELQREGASR